MKKQMVSEEVLKMQKIAGIITESQLKEALETLNEDNLEVKKIARDLYSWFKKNGVAARLIANAPSGKPAGSAGKVEPQDSNKSGSATIFYYDNPQTKQTEIQINLQGNKEAIESVEKKFLSAYSNLQQFDRKLDQMTGSSNGSLNFKVKEKTTKKGGLVGNTPTKPAAQPEQ